MPHQQLFKNIFHKTINGDERMNLLQQVKNEYPYFAAPHYFLLKHTEVTSADYDNITATTALHFANPFLLNFQLTKSEEQLYVDTPVYNTEAAEEQEHTVEKESTDESGPQYLQEDNVVEEAEHNDKKEKEGVAEEEIQPQYLQEEIMQNDAVEKEEHPDNLVQQEEVAEDVQPQYLQEVKVKEENMVQEVQPQYQQQEKTPEENVALQQAPKILSEEKIPENKNSEDLIFEPLYTTDYFASQGIRLNDEIKPTDKLGKQLKSFTEWLKTMKKVHEGRLPPGSEQLDATVQNLAEKSNKEDEIVTEAMADAYLLQGKAAKARDIYLKLSLLNPAKSAFFAAKIEQLKEK